MNFREWIMRIVSRPMKDREGKIPKTVEDRNFHFNRYDVFWVVWFLSAPLVLDFTLSPIKQSWFILTLIAINGASFLIALSKGVFAKRLYAGVLGKKYFDNISI